MLKLLGAETSPLRGQSEGQGHAKGREGFTLPEVLVSAIILVAATVGAIIAFNLITQSVRGTGIRTDQSRLIDQDISRISLLSERFSSCQVPQGSIPTTACAGNGVAEGNSYYYFPQITDPANPATWTDAEAFEAACRDGTLRSNFITAIGPQADLGIDGNVRRLAPTALNGSNHLIRVTWVDQSQSNRVLRSLDVAPVVSSWCP